MRESIVRSCVCIVVALMAASCRVGLAAAYPQVQAYPQVSANPIITDGTTIYTVTTTISDADGYSDIACIRILFNFTEANPETTRGRGYLAWGKTDANITEYGGTWVLADSGGSGRWGYRTDAWGGTTYISPVSCSVTTGGLASGGTGTVTATWTFKAKSAWAMNPLINDVDVWIKDASGNMLGWKDNPASFDVVRSACTSYCATPRPLVILGATASSISFLIDPADSSADRYLVRVSPAFQGREYVQTDGTLGAWPVYQLKSQWGDKTITGLASDTTYSLSIRAANTTGGVCPSEWNAPVSRTTGMVTRSINYALAGTPINKGIMGMDAQPKILSAQRDADDLAASWNSSMRYGGDGYIWKTRTAQWNSGTRSTLRCLRDARDHNSWVLNLTNTRGIGTGNGSTWVYTDYSASTLATLAADWVFYCNKILQTKRQGDPLDAREQAILDSMSWGTDDKLLAPGEAPVQRVTYWEIGNEPEGPYPPPVLTTTEYAEKYKALTQAMLAEDPTIKVGPCVMSADNGNAWLDAVLSDPTNQVDFVCYHPYGTLYGITKYQSGGVLNADDLNGGLNGLKKQQTDRRQKVIDRLAANSRPTNTPLMATEFNPSSWEGTYYFTLNRTVAHALGLADTMFAFAQLGFLGAQYWDLPNNPSTAIEAPGFKVFKEMQAHMGDRLLEWYDETDFRLYTTLDSKTGRLIIWALNLSEYRDKSIRFTLAGDTSQVTATLHRLAAISGDTSLILKNASNDPYEKVQWTRSALTGLDLSGFTINFPRATMTMLRLDRPLKSLPDGTAVTLSGKSVTAAYPSDGYLYVEQDDRSYGIRVAGAFSDIVAGDRVDVAGTMQTIKPDGETPAERYIQAQTIAKTSNGTPLEPTVMNGRFVGGESTHEIAGVKDGSGLSNIGLLVRTWGRVAQVGSGYMYVDDGTNLKDGTYTGSEENVGIRVVCDPSGWSSGDYVEVTGISTCFLTPSSDLAREILTRSTADVRDMESE